jgi:hypothetical protein
MKRQERPAERPRPIASHRPDLDLEEGIGSGEQGGDLCQGKCGAGAVRASHASAAAVRRLLAQISNLYMGYPNWISLSRSSVRDSFRVHRHVRDARTQRTDPPRNTIRQK